jgi:hypothetical protein
MFGLHRWLTLNLALYNYTTEPLLSSLGASEEGLLNAITSPSLSKLLNLSWIPDGKPG